MMKLTCFVLLVTCLLLAQTAVVALGADLPEGILNATELGLIPDTGKDSAAAARAVMEACASRKIKKLVLAPGRYDFAEQTLGVDTAVFHLKGVEGLEIEGNGAQLFFRGKVSAFRLERCRGVTVRGVVIDWAVLPFAQGEVTACTETTADVVIDSGYEKAQPQVIEGVMDYEPKTLLPIGNLDVFRDYVSAEWSDPKHVRLTFKVDKHPDKREYARQSIRSLKGRKLVLRYAVYGNYGFDCAQSRDIRLENVSIYCVPGMALHANRCENVTLLKMDVQPRPESGRLMSTTADCIFITHCTGTIRIEDSLFANTGDDGLNITGAKYGTLVRKTGARQIEVAPPPKVWEGPVPATDDVLEFSGARDLVVVARVPVVKAVYDKAAKRFVVDLAQDLPEAVREGDFVVNRRYCAKGRILRSTYRGQRSRAIVLSTEDVLIDQCRFEHMPEPAIMLKGGSRHHGEGPTSKQIVVRNSFFDRCGGPAVQASAGAPEAGQDVVENVVIEGNTIRMDPTLRRLRVFNQYSQWAYLDSGLCLSSIRGLTIRRNVFEGPYGVAMLLDRVRNVTVEENRCTPDNRIVVDEGTCAEVVVGNNPGLARVNNTGDKISSFPYRINDLR